MEIATVAAAEPYAKRMRLDAERIRLKKPIPSKSEQQQR